VTIRSVPGTEYESPEVQAAARIRKCPICGPAMGSHDHALSEGELAEIEAVRRGERGWDDWRRRHAR
jgi:hypothetical protein